MNDYEAAMNVQSAPNLRGILRSMVELADKYPPNHPILRLFAEQVIFLTGGYGDQKSYSKAYDAVEEEIEK